VPAFGDGRQGIEQIVARALRKVLKVLPGRLYLLDRSSVSYHATMVANLSPSVKCASRPVLARLLDLTARIN
jgi:hypothetical protein